MDGNIFVLPFITMIVGIVSIFVNPKQKNRRWLVITLVVSFLLGCGAEIYFNYEKDRSAKQNTEWNRSHINSLTDVILSFRKETSNQFKNLKLLLKDFGWSDRYVGRIEESITANIERSELSKRSSIEPRRRITIEYFPKDVDGRTVRKAIEELGFRLKEKRPVIGYIPTNAIWYGSEVRIEDLKLLAFTLIRAGVEIRAIRSYQVEKNRSQVIQVGADVSIKNKPVLSVNEIRDTKMFTR
jgi:hypothetical protein